eukprot:5520237-Pyramimonas_sp.AAC.4
MAQPSAVLATSEPGLQISLVLCGVFFAVLLAVVLRNSIMFRRRFGRRHRIVGLVYLLWLLFGFVDLAIDVSGNLVYDIVLSALGIALSLTAANDFKFHDRVQNPASGALDEDATITYNEMVEHSFYQGLNLVQVCYLHSFQLDLGLGPSLVLLYLATLPWSIRDCFPVNSFSDNFKKKSSTTLIDVMYRLKKYQYLLYKHYLLHGLNISLAFSGEHLTSRPFFRVYWLGLNTAYVMEFFLQTLVKRRYLQQKTMLYLNQLLMLATTLPALQLIFHTNLLLGTFSLFLNITNRGHELINVLLTTMCGVGITLASNNGR